MGISFIINFVVIGLLALIYQGKCQTCEVDIPDAERRDCYPWPGASQAACESRGCVWCASDQTGYPHCFYNDKVCPSQIPEASRVDCLPDDPNGNKDKCNRAGCIWCESSTPGIPWCFTDSGVSQGGNVCPSSIAETERIDCHPEFGATQARCLARGCYWCSATGSGVPWCFTPQENGYRMVGNPVATAKGWTVDLSRVNTPSWFGSDIANLRVDVEYHTEERLRIKIHDPSTSRFEVPLTIPSPPSKPAETLYDVQFIADPVFCLKVIRKSNGAVLFDTSIGGLIFADQFLQIATYLNTANVFGFGEQEHHSFRQNMTWQWLPMYSRDQAVTTSNLYGVHPFYLNVEQSASAHGVLFLNANAQEVTLQPHPALTYRTTGGILDIYLFLGPTPESVVQQYGQAVSFPVMVPYWSLGFQLCRWGYTDLTHMQQAVARLRQYDIPHDVQYGDIDYMDRKLDFTIDPINFAGLPDYVNKLKAEGTRFVIILDPFISYTQSPGSYQTFENGQAANVWVKQKDGSSNAQGVSWPGPVYYPDYHKQATEDWWVNECRTFKQRLDFAGLWIDMNEPSSDSEGSPAGCSNDPINIPPYIPRVVDSNGNPNSRLYQKTLCLDTKYSIADSYNVHSLYGWSMARASARAARESTGLRSVVFSRSTFPGAGQWGQHWLGDNFSRWSNLRWSIMGLLEFNMFGFPYVGADICGFNEQTTEEMCTRWQQLGAFYTFSRNHNAAGNPDQDPGMWPQVAQVTRESLHIRYTLLPYLYTLFYRAHTRGGTVIRSLLFEFTQDTNTYGINDQFLWGPAFMISPVLDQGVTAISVYFTNTRWYNYYDGAKEATRGASRMVSAPITYIPLHIRGGYILPTQRPSNSTMFSRQLPMGLIVALSDTATATGELFWDDGDSQNTIENGNYLLLQFQSSAGSVTSSVQHNGYSTTLVFADARVMGIEATVSAVTVNGTAHSSWTQDSVTRQLTISNMNLPIGLAFTISWA